MFKSSLVLCLSNLARDCYLKYHAAAPGANAPSVFAIFLMHATCLDWYSNRFLSILCYLAELGVPSIVGASWARQDPFACFSRFEHLALDTHDIRHVAAFSSRHLISDCPLKLIHI